MVGNGVTNWGFDTAAAYLDLAYWHNFVDSDFYWKVKGSGCSLAGVSKKPQFESEECNKLSDDFEDMLEGVNIYNVVDNCYQSKTSLMYTPWVL